MLHSDAALMAAFSFARSRAVAAASRWSSKRSAYVSSVIVAEAWPSIYCNAFTFSPAEIANEAAVCR